MNRSLKYILVILLFASLTGFLQGDRDIYFKITKSIDLFGRVYKEIALNYVDELDPEDFMNEGIEGMLSSLDPYTVFIDESHKGDIDLITTGKYGGVGATVGIRNNKITVVDLIEGYSAQRQGIRMGDVISRIDSVGFSIENYNELGAYMKGKPGTEVEITIIRDGEGEPIIFNLVREEVVLKNLSYYGFQPEGSNNAYLKLSGFSPTAGEEVKNALVELSADREINTIVLDLRGNPGGLLNAAVDVAEKFLDKGSLIVSVNGKDSTSRKEYYSTEVPVAGEMPLAVLIDNGSASASEIVTGAIQDHDSGVIIGETSFGKGLVQTVIPISNKASLKITTARYFTPSGRCIQKIDYSNGRNKDVIISSDEKNNYFTDNGRVVESGGGIVPDSIVSSDSESGLIRNLLARGMFFRFATKYFNENVGADLQNINDDDIFNSFMEFLGTQEFEYVSRSEKLLNELIDETKSNGYDHFIEKKLLDVQKTLRDADNQEIIKYRDDVIAEINQELAARSSGAAGRVVEHLKYDKQFSAAIAVMNNDSLYYMALKNK